MITSTMTAREIAKIREADDEQLRRFAERKRKVLRKSLGNGIHKVSCCYDYKTKNAEYKIIVRVTKKLRGMILYMHEKENNEFIMATSSNLTQIKISAHYWKRVSERLYHEPMTINKVMGKYDPLGVPLFYRNGDFVFANEKGLSLGKWDGAFYHFKTFVSLEMLRKTQLDAFLKVEKFIYDINNYQNGGWKNAFDGTVHGFSYFGLVFGSQMDSNMLLAQEEYEKYFKRYADD